MGDKLTPVQLDELRCIAQGRDHCERPTRKQTRDLLQRRRLIVWWVDPAPTREHNETRWMLTGMGRVVYAAASKEKP